MAIKLGDDGTLDTVVFCTVCGQEERFNFHLAYSEESDPPNPEAEYAAFVDECIADMEEEHECPGVKS